MRRGKRAASQGFTLLELIVAMSLSVFVLIGVIQAATSVIAIQLDTHRRDAAEGSSLTAALSFTNDLRNTTYLECPGGPSCAVAGTRADILSGCTNWSKNMNGGAGVLTSNTIPVGDECAGSGNTVKAFYYCTPTPSYTPGANVQLIRYVKCGTTCSIPAPGPCGTVMGNPVSMTYLVPAYPGFYYMDGLSKYYERTDSGVALHFIVGIGTPTQQGVSQGGMNRNAPIAVSYKFNMSVNMNKSYNTVGD